MKINPKLITVIVILTIILFGTLSTPQQSQPYQLLATALPSRITVNDSNTVYDCKGGVIPGLTVNGSNATVRNCVMSGWSGTGLWVNGSNNVLEYIVINDGVIGNGDKDGVRFFGSGHTFRNIKITINTCALPAHCDGVQTYGSNSGSNATFDGMEIHNFTSYDNSSASKGNCFMLEYGAHDIEIKNSLLNCYRNIMLGDSAYPATDNIKIHNNTFVGRIPPPVSSIPEFGVFVAKGTNTVVQNNIFYNMAGEHLYGSITAGYNWIYRTDGARIYAPTYSTDKLSTNPLLDTDYRPLGNSPICALGWGAFKCGSVTPTFTPTQITPTFTPTPVSPSTTPSVLPPPTATLTPTVTPTIAITPVDEEIPVCFLYFRRAVEIIKCP